MDNIIYQPFIIAESELSTQTTITNRYTNTNDDALQRASQNSYDSKCYPPPPRIVVKLGIGYLDLFIVCWYKVGAQFLSFTINHQRFKQILILINVCLML
ncbi:hypothetical protein CQA66_02335 [Helicobacter aurati]|uniref:Uncharacterized protein n=1 Tax=Helicobacter aurati TaxID=137778 RepID=A0A3D8J6L3_9HELI|nr:hypothetical protein CQA66_02335 [Helicobacter aurati]